MESRAKSNPVMSICRLSTLRAPVLPPALVPPLVVQNNKPPRPQLPPSWGRFFLLVAAYLSDMPSVAFEPCIPTRGTKEWLHEIKHDG